MDDESSDETIRLRDCAPDDIVRFPWDSLPDGRWAVGDRPVPVQGTHPPWHRRGSSLVGVWYIGDSHPRGEMSLPADVPVEVQSLTFGELEVGEHFHRANDRGDSEWVKLAERRAGLIGGGDSIQFTEGEKVERIDG